ncbi:MAG TPA: hypothetical protein VEW66_02575, partial [Thermomicrobiales bacterium]|nr:hypothetical protein [Thermomicrobiales bacterium]
QEPHDPPPVHTVWLLDHDPDHWVRIVVCAPQAAKGGGDLVRLVKAKGEVKTARQGQGDLQRMGRATAVHRSKVG